MADLEMHAPKDCPLRRHLAADQIVIPLCQQCVGHNPMRDELHKLRAFVRMVAKRLQGCECWETHGFGAPSTFIGCIPHNSDDPQEWCVGCEARTIEVEMDKK